MDLTTLGVARTRCEVEQTRRATHIEKFRQFRTEIPSARSQPLTGLEIPIAFVTRNERERSLHRTQASRATAHRNFVNRRPRFSVLTLRAKNTIGLEPKLPTVSGEKHTRPGTGSRSAVRCSSTGVAAFYTAWR